MPPVPLYSSIYLASSTASYSIHALDKSFLTSPHYNSGTVDPHILSFTMQIL